MNPIPKIDVVTDIGDRHIIFDEEIYLDSRKMNHILIESDIIPL